MAEEERKKPDVVLIGSGMAVDAKVLKMAMDMPGKSVMVVGDDKVDNFFEGMDEGTRKLIFGAMADFEPPRLDVRKVAELRKADYFGVEKSGREKRVSKRKKAVSKFSDEVRKKLRSK